MATQSRQGVVLVVGLALVAVAWWQCGDAPKPPPAVVAPTPTPTPVVREKTPGELALAKITPAEDTEREALIASSQKSGLFGEIDYRRHEVFVGAQFYALDFKVKQAVIWSIVLTGMRKTNTPSFDLDLLDIKSGKKVGRYSCLWWKLEMET
jgi:hypothetical protein